MPQRTPKWDNLKALLIFCVVAGHFIARIDSEPNARRVIFFIYLFHMPAFMFLSGLMSKRTIRERRYDRLCGFLIAFFLIKLVLLLIRIVVHHDLKCSLIAMNDISWYMFVLFVFHLFTILISRFRPVPVLILSVAAACAAGYVSAFGTDFSLSRIFSFYPFFFAGYVADQRKILELTAPLKIRITAAGILAAAAAAVYLKIDRLWWLLRILKGKSPYAELQYMSTQGWLLRLVWYCMAAILILSLIALAPETKGFLATIGSRTLQIYMLHYVPLSIFFSALHGMHLIKHAGHGTPILLVASAATVLILSVKPLTLLVDKCISPPFLRR